MNTHTRFTNTNFTNLDELLDQKLIELAANAVDVTKSGPPGDPVNEAGTQSAPSAISDNGQSGQDLPFLNLDPYNLDGKDNLPTGDLTEGPQGMIGSGVEISGGAGEQQVNFALEMEGYTFRSDAGRLDIMALTEERTTEIKTMTFNGQEVAVEYQSGLAYGFEGSFYDNQFRELYVEMNAEVATSIQTEAFDADGNPILTSFGYEQMLEVTGQGFDYGIEEFSMAFEFMIDIQRNDFGFYEITISVTFEGEIVDMNGFAREFLFEDESMFLFSDLDQIDFDQLPPGFYEEIARFANGMGEAWDAFGSVNDQIEAVLLKLREEGHYQAWDDADQGLNDPFDFNLPNTDPFS
ncbi:MAG: hypothetical protein RDA78_19020 [Roseibium sp.]|uniref:hypothetical protein n=1 Tax=Roseibium sp. TaxID=1936156 RepID=UPI003D9C1696